MRGLGEEEGFAQPREVSPFMPLLGRVRRGDGDGSSPESSRKGRIWLKDRGDSSTAGIQCTSVHQQEHQRQDHGSDECRGSSGSPVEANEDSRASVTASAGLLAEPRKPIHLGSGQQTYSIFPILENLIVYRYEAFELGASPTRPNSLTPDRATAAEPSRHHAPKV